MTLPASINIQTAFNLRTATPVFNIQDLTPFASESITLSNVKGNFKIVDPLGNTVYENTSLSTPDLKSFSITGITQVAGVATVTCATAHGMITGDYVVIAGAGQGGYNIQGQITKVSATVFTYLVSSGTVTPATGTILGLNMSLNTIQIPLDSGTNKPLIGTYTVTLTTVVGGGTQPGTYAKDFIYTYSYVRPVVSIVQSINCFIARFVSTDVTTYTVNGIAPTITRTHNITFPAVSGIAVETFVTQRVQLDRPKVWNGIYITSISTLLSYINADNLVILDTATGSQDFTVSCQDICNINCCLNDANNAYKNALLNSGTNSPLTVSALAIFSRAIQLAGLFQMNIQCGNTTGAATNLQDIYIVTGCTPDCNCGSADGEVIPYDGFIGKTILEWDADLGNSQYDYINYQNTLYRVLQNTLPGQTPISDPSLFHIIGTTGVWGTITGTLSSQTDLQTALNNKVTVFDRTNTSSGSSTVTINAMSGRAMFTQTVGPLQTVNCRINSSLIAATDSYRTELNYPIATTGFPGISYREIGAGFINIIVTNSDASDSTSASLVIDFQKMN